MFRSFIVPIFLLNAILLWTGCKTTEFRVVDVLSGDSFVVDIDGREQKVHLLGIKSPGVKDLKGFNTAKDVLTQLISDQYVKLIDDVPGNPIFDNEGVRHAYVLAKRSDVASRGGFDDQQFENWTNVGATILMTGWGRFEPDLELQNQTIVRHLRESERSARDEKLGYWIVWSGESESLPEQRRTPIYGPDQFRTQREQN
ncbi:MAG: hypothetical protein NUW37_00860 [Planctomycetes bacterium]|nr:hypothetical protein [Planctomycetota bacterium]